MTNKFASGVKKYFFFQKINLVIIFLLRNFLNRIMILIRQEKMVIFLKTCFFFLFLRFTFYSLGTKKWKLCTTRLRLAHFTLTCCVSVHYDLSTAAYLQKTKCMTILSLRVHGVISDLDILCRPPTCSVQVWASLTCRPPVSTWKAGWDWGKQKRWLKNTFVVCFLTRRA